MKKTLLISAIAATMLTMTGCGSSDNPDNPNSPTQPEKKSSLLTGTVATGSGASSEIIFVGAQGLTLEGKSDDNGFYSIDASSLTQPIMVKATLDRDGSILYSFAESTTGVVNVTPLTSFVVDQAAQAAGLSGGASQLFQNYTTVDRDVVTTQVESQTQRLDTVIASQMSEDGVTEFDHFSGDFDADHTGYDALLDNLDLVVYQDDVIIREGDTTLDTLNYDIAVSEINATGVVYNITDGLPMGDANITFTNNINESKSVVTNSNGVFILPIDTMRTYTVTITANGFETQVLPNVSSFAFTQENFGSIPMFPEGVSANTILSGKVIDGRTSDTALENVSINFRAGYDNRIGEVVQTAITDASGNYETTLASGVYTAELTVDGYAQIYRNVEVFGDTFTWDAIMLAEGVDAASGAFATITLNWDANPSDLDSHLTGPSADENGSRFHMAFYNPEISSYSETMNNESTADSEYEQDVINYARTQLEDISGEDLSSLTTLEQLGAYSETLTVEQQEIMNSRMEEYSNSHTVEYSTQQADIDPEWIDYMRTQLEDITGENLSSLTTMEEINTYFFNNLTAEQQATFESRMEAYSSETEQVAMNALVDDVRTQLEDITGENLSSLTTMEEINTYVRNNLTTEQQETFASRMEEYTNSQTEEVSSTPICADGVIANLDRDRTDDYDGLLPETTTLCSVTAGGMYKYYVHEYAGEGTISSGHATVTVTTSSGVTNTFTAPSIGETGVDDIWHVFNIDANGNIYPVNQIVGNGSAESTLFAAPSHTNSADKPFQAEKGLLDNLPAK